MTEQEALAQATQDIEDAKPLYKNVNGENLEYNDADYEQAIIDRKDFLYNQHHFEYKKERQLSYASIQDQLDMQYWDAVNGTTTWKDHIAQVKSDNPKPV